MLSTSRHLHAPLISRTSGRSLENVKHSDAPPEIGRIGKKCSFLLLGLTGVTRKKLYACENATKVKRYRQTWNCVPSTLVIILYILLVFMVIYCRYKFRRGPGSVVGIATVYGLDGPGIESRWRRDFPHLSRPT
jgi:hypothetical protein